MPNVPSVDSAYPVQYNLDRPVPKKFIDHPTYTEYVYETSATTGKKVGVGIASAFISGLGQCINGEWGKGIAMFLGTIVMNVISLTGRSSKSSALPIIGGLGAFAIGLTSIIDAVKHARSETVQIVPKKNGDASTINYSA